MFSCLRQLENKFVVKFPILAFDFQNNTFSKNKSVETKLDKIN